MLFLELLTSRGLYSVAWGHLKAGAEAYQEKSFSNLTEDDMDLLDVRKTIKRAPDFTYRDVLWGGSTDPLAADDDIAASVGMILDNGGDEMFQQDVIRIVRSS